MSSQKQKQLKKAQSLKETVLTPVLESRLPLIFSIVLFAAWLIFVVKNYWQSYPFAPFETLDRVFSLQGLPNADWGQVTGVWVHHIINIVFVAAFWLSAFGWGTLFLRSQEYTIENNLFRLAFGNGVIVAFVLLIGLAGFLYPYPVLAFLVTGLAIGLTKASKHWKGIPALSFPAKEKLFLLLLCYPLLHGIIGALSAETFYDSTVYHLGVPQAWINFHRIYQMNSVHMSFYPFNTQILYTIGLLLRDESAAKLIHLSLGIATSMALFAMLKKYFTRTVAWLGTVIFVCTPFVMVVAGKTAIEMGLAFYETLAFFAFINWMNNKERKWLIIAAVCSGLGMGSKYTSLYAFFALVVILISFRLFRDKAPLKDVALESGLFMLVAGIVVSPWLIRNMIWVHNPVYPLLWEKIGTLKLRSLGYFNDPPRRPFTLKNIVMLPWEYAMSKQIQEPFCGPLFILFIPLFFLFKRKNKQIDPFIGYSLIYYFVWQFAQAHFRLFIPALPVMSSVYAYWIGSQPGAAWRKTLIWTVAILSFGNVQLASLLQKYSENPLGTTLGLVPRSEYLAKGQGAGSYVCPNFKTIDWVNNNLPDSSYILFLGETRGLYCKRRFLTHTVSEYVPITEWVKKAANEDDVYRILKQQGFTHILLNVREAYRLRSYNMYYWNDKEWDIFNRFWAKYVKELYNADWVYIYEILPPEQAAIMHQPPQNYLFEIYKKNQ